MSLMGARVRKAIAAPLTLVMAVAIAGQVSPGTATAAWRRPTPEDVKGVKVRAVPASHRPSWTAGAREFTAKDVVTPQTASGEQVVDLGTKVTGRGRQAGKLPVYVARAATSSTTVSKVRVKLLARTAGFDGAALQLSRADGVPSPGQARVTVDYDSLSGVCNRDALSRLRLVNLADGTPIASSNDVRAGTVSATVSLSAAAVSVAQARPRQGDNPCPQHPIRRRMPCSRELLHPGQLITVHSGTSEHQSGHGHGAFRR